ncbi:hypothetical protein HDU98_002881 [Podochytrium sp. JEL0797]|nr:hypothetical protein HDU98_002881 [Podochytrium sp. JEL0797]
MDASTDDDIRAKRLAKMGGSSSSSSSSTSDLTGSGNIGPSSPAKAKAPATPKPAPVLKPTTPPGTTTTPNKQVALFVNAPAAVWAHQTLGFVFRVALNEPTASAKQHTLLVSLKDDLTALSLPSDLLAPQIADALVHARLSRPENAREEPLFDYLVQCWKRCREAHQRINQVKERAAGSDAALVATLAKERISILDEIRALIVSYSGLVVNPDMGDMFPQQEEITKQGAGYIASKLLLDGFASEEQLPTEFLREFVARFENDGLDEIMGPVINSVTAAMRFQDITTDFMTPLRALGTLLSHPAITTILTSMPNFNPPNSAARTFELLTILGPYFSKPCVFNDEQGKVGKTYFASSNAFGESSNRDREGLDIGTRNFGDVESAMTNLRGTISNVQSTLHNLTMTLIKSGPIPRTATLQFLADAITLNHARGRMQVDPKTVGTDGFLFNLAKVCLQLCDPLLDASLSKLSLIEPHNFLRPDARLPQPPTTTLMNADDAYLDAQRALWVQQNSTAPPANFVTQVFVLTLGALHFGYLSSVRSLQGFMKQLRELEKAVEGMKKERDDGVWVGRGDAGMKEMTLKRYQAQLDMWISHRLVLTTTLLDKVTIDQVMRFYNLVMMWMIRGILVGSGTDVTRVNWVQLARGAEAEVGGVIPFPEAIPAVFATLPEWIFEDVVEFYLFVVRFKPTLFENTLRDEFLLFSVAMLQSPGYVKNPHLKSKLIEVLFHFTLPLYRDDAGARLDVVFSTNGAAKKYLIPGIMRFYVDAEFTGDSRAFYEKLNNSNTISKIRHAVWDDPNHRLALISESHKPEFIKFANLLMNDTSYLLDEGLSKLSEIHRIQSEMDDVLVWGALAQDVREQKEKNLAELERGASSYIQLSSETVNMLRYLTSEERVVDPFMAPYIVERLAAMLDYNLTTLVGPKCTELKVKDPEKYRFNPKSLLTKLADIFLHLAHRTEFVNAVAKDERSYKKDLFARAAEILARHGLKDSRDLEALRAFVEKVEEAIRNTLVEDEELGDVPDEFLDPLMASLMEDPVILPTSNITVDRSTIITQLLSNPLDPFNRKPLTIEMVIPDVELKQKIEAWKRQQRSGHATPMETD